MAGHPTRYDWWSLVPVIAVLAVIGFGSIQVQYNDAPGVSLLRGLGKEFMSHDLSQPRMTVENGRPSFSLLFLWVLLLMLLFLGSSILKKPVALILTSVFFIATWAYLYCTFFGVFNRTVFIHSSVFFILSTLLLVLLSILRLRAHRL